MDKKQIGVWAFIIGALVAVISGIGQAASQAWANNAWLMFILVALGLVIGILNIKKKETTSFLVAAIALVVMAASAQLVNIDPVIPYIGQLLAAIIAKVVLLVAPAALVVSLKAVYDLANE